MRICSRNTRRSGPAAFGLMSTPLSACQMPASPRSGPRLARSFGATVGSVKISAGKGSMGSPVTLLLVGHVAHPSGDLLSYCLGLFSYCPCQFAKVMTRIMELVDQGENDRQARMLKAHAVVQVAA